jgi:hypothetical protein
MDPLRAGGGARIGDVEATANVTFMGLPDEIIAIILELVLRDIGTEGNITRAGYVAPTDVTKWFMLSGVDKRLRHILRESVRGDITGRVASGLEDEKIATLPSFVGRVSEKFKMADKLALVGNVASEYPGMADLVFHKAVDFLSSARMTVRNRATGKTPLMVAASCACTKLVGLMLARARGMGAGQTDMATRVRDMNPGVIVAKRPSVLEIMLSARDPPRQHRLYACCDTLVVRKSASVWARSQGRSTGHHEAVDYVRTHGFWTRRGRGDQRTKRGG